MSNLLSQASLVMIPSGYKEDVVYSAVPTNGNGDLSFTRASNGTRVNSAGLVEVVPWNIVQESETFTNVLWNLYYATVTSNSQTAPNGTLTADTLNSTTQQYSGIYQSLGTLPTNVYTYSIYVKAGTNTFFGMLGQGSGSQIAIFNLSTGVVSSTSNLDSASIENVGNGWYRCQIQKTGAGVEMLIFSSNIANSIPTASGTVFIWGAQLNIGSTAKPYFPTTDRLNVPRLTYQNGGGGCPSLLLEKQSTNLVSWSDDFSNSDWGKYQCSVSTNQTTSPDGTQNADKLTLSGNSGTYTGLVYRTTTPAANSIYMKNDSIGSGKFYIQVDGVGNAKWNSDGTLNSVSGGTATNGENMGNGWFRFAYVVTSGAYINCGIVDGTTGDSIFIWGAQVEAGSYPTSLINTTSSSATRVADVCSKTGISSLIGQTEGVLFCQFNKPVDSLTSLRLSISDGSFSNWVFVGFEGLYLRAYLRANNTVIETQNFSTTSNVNKIAIAYKSGNYAIYHNGTQIATGSTTYSFSATLNQLSFGETPTDLTIYAVAQIAQFELFPTRLTNAELASLTTI